MIQTLPLSTWSPGLSSLGPLLTIYIFCYQITDFSVLLVHEHPRDKRYMESRWKILTVAQIFTMSFQERGLGPASYFPP